MAYYIAEFEPTVPGAIQPYSASVESTFRPFGGRFIVRGGGVELLEGMPPSGRLVIIAFDSVDQARAWYNSPAYEAIKTESSYNPNGASSFTRSISSRSPVGI